MANKVEKFEDPGSIIREYEEIIRIKNTNIVRISYQEGEIFKKFKEKERFIKMVETFGVTKLIIIFKVNMLNLISKYLRLMKSSVNLNLLKTYLENTREI